MNILIVTKSRSGYGAHVVLTAIIRQLRATGHDVEVIVSEHRLERQKWAEHSYLWDGIDPRIIEFDETTLTEHDPTYGPYAYTDDILLHDKRLVELLRSLPTDQYDLVLLDSWYLMYSAMLSGIHLRDNVYQFVQSEPVFEPTTVDDEWKAAIFRLMPWVKAKRIFVSRSLATKFNGEYSQWHGAIGFFLDAAFLGAKHIPRPLVAKRLLRVVSMASNLNIPSKGLRELLQALDKLHALHPVELKIISTVPITAPMHTRFPIRIVNDAIDPGRRAGELAAADLYATCTLNESPGLAQAEAMAVGLPVVAMDSNGNWDYYNGDNFLMADNADDFGAKLINCLDDDTRVRLAAAAKESMRDFSVEAASMRLLTYAQGAKADASSYRSESVPVLVD